MNVLVGAYLVSLSVCVSMILFIGARMILELIKTYTGPNNNPEWRI
jgi:hypothetical protein